MKFEISLHKLFFQYELLYNNNPKENFRIIIMGNFNF